MCVAAGLGIFINGFSSILTGLNFIVTIHTMRAPGMTWFRLPLFIWAHYATSLVMILGTPVIAITILLLAFERAGRVGIFDPAAWRRPDSVPTPVLVLLASGCLHHDPAVDGRGQRTDRKLLAQEHLRLQVRRVLEFGDRRVWLPRLGPSPVCDQPVGLRRDDLFVPEFCGCDSVRGQGVQLDGHALQGRRSHTTRRCSTR